MMVVGRAGSVGRKTVLLYVITTVTASVVGLLSAIAVKGLFSEGSFDEKPPASVMLGCNIADTFITESEDGSLSCSAEMGSSSEFILEDLSRAFVKSGSGPSSSYSLSDTVYDGVFMKLVTANITESFTQGNFAAVVVFAVVFGMALSSHLFKQGKAVKGSVVLTFLKEMEKTLMQIIYWIIMITPFAVLSLISAQVGKQDDLLDKFANVGYLILSLLLGLAAHSLLIHFGLWYIITKTNPIDFLKFLIPAQTMAFACSSSAATLPMTQKCVKSTNRVPDSISRFVLPLGATVNMDGTTIYFTTCCIW
jgi:solute carrier family 1 (high affinity glutamate transporter) protein 2